MKSIAAVAFALSAVPAAATVPLAGGVAFTAFVALEANSVTASDEYAWANVPELASVGVDAFTQFTPASVSAFAGGDATWASADAGAMTFDHGWQFSKDDPFTYDAVADVSTDGQPTWFYSFTATSNGVFNLQWDNTAIGNPLGFDGWWLYWNGGSLAIPGAVSNGSANIEVLAGQNYTVELQNYAVLYMLSGVVDFGGQQHSNFSWSITSRPNVPEPATWAMLITGFGLVGAAMRRRVAAVSNNTTHGNRETLINL